MGENWHNNHHAFPRSARMGLFPGQVDPGWWLIRTFAAFGLASNIKTPVSLLPRPELRRLPGVDDGWLAGNRLQIARWQG
jgi:stearoyl-CoA desaturase (delta-9 desaturase)